MRPPAPKPAAAYVLPAILQIVAGVMLFSCSDATAKYLRQTLPAVEIAWLRYLVFVAMSALLIGRHPFRGVLTKRPGLQVLRGVTILGSALTFIAGLSFMPIADASAISFVSPAFITALSVVFLGEKVGVHRWSATLAGLIGVLIVIRPGVGALQFAALFPLVSAAFWAVAMIATKLIGTQDRGEVTLFWTATVGLLLLTAALPFTFVPLGWTQIGLGLMLGVAASCGQYLIVLAYRRASASVLAPFSYIQLLSSSFLGYLVFGSLPDKIAFLGAAVIMASGLYIFFRERVRSRQRLKTDGPEARMVAVSASSESSDGRREPAPSAS